MTDRLITGWSPHLDIPSALCAVSPDRLAKSVALISMVDSTPRVYELPSLVSLLVRRGEWHDDLQGDLLVYGGTLRRMVDEFDMLTGFDEIWLCDRRPLRGKPRSLRLTSDVPLTNGLGPDAAEWMRGASCYVGLGDGDGLNFATFENELAAAWRTRGHPLTASEQEPS